MKYEIGEEEPEDIIRAGRLAPYLGTIAFGGYRPIGLPAWTRGWPCRDVNNGQGKQGKDCVHLGHRNTPTDMVEAVNIKCSTMFSISKAQWVNSLTAELRQDERRGSQCYMGIRP